MAVVTTLTKQISKNHISFLFFKLPLNETTGLDSGHHIYIKFNMFNK